MPPDKVAFVILGIVKRILVIGKSGAGKTTFSNNLAEALEINVCYLDDLFWKSGWERVYSAEQWEQKISELILQDEWILDGNYHNTLKLRLSRADTVIFFDINPVISFVQALIRKYFDKTEDGIDIHQKAGLGKMIKTIFTFPTKEIYSLIKQSEVKDVRVVKSRRDAEKLLAKIKNQS